MKPLRALLPAPPLSLLKLGSYDDYRFQQPPPTPSTLSSPAFFLSAEQNPFPLFRPPFLNHPATYRMKGSGGKWKRGGVLAAGTLLTLELCD